VPHLELEQLTKRYGDVTSVDHISLAVERGEFICLLGPSGCGKTTTLRMIAGFLEPDEGRIKVGDKVVSRPGSVVPPERRNMGMIFQSYAVWPHMTVRDNVAYGLKMKKVEAVKSREQVDAMLKATKLFELAARYPSELSGGQQQRVALARALAPNPAILIADEPTGNLDETTGLEIIELLFAGHEQRGTTLVLVTHDAALAARCDRVVRLRSGRIEDTPRLEAVKA